MRVMTISLHTSPRGCPKPVSCLSAAEISFASRVILLENSSLWLLSASLRKEKALGFSLSSPRITLFIAKIPALSWVGGVFSLETCRHMLMLLLSYLLLWTCISFSSVSFSLSPFNTEHFLAVSCDRLLRKRLRSMSVLLADWFFWFPLLWWRSFCSIFITWVLLQERRQTGQH